MTRHVVVVGAGIVGVSSAIWLHRAAPGTGTSHGNAGVLAACAVAPVTAPGLIAKAPAMLLNPDVPLYLRLPYLPRLLPWLAKYLRVANDRDTRRIAQGLAPIVSDSVDQHKSLTADLGLSDWVRDSDYVFAYRNRAAFDAEAYTWALRAEAGFAPELIEGPQIHEYEPTLGPDIHLLATMRDHGFIRDPGGYVGALARAFEQGGGTILQAEVKDFDLSGGAISGVETTQGRMACDDIVLATGGGAFMDEETRQKIKERAFSVWLRADFDVLLRRVSRRDNRPLLKVENKEEVLRRLIEERYPIYQKADIIVQSQDGPHEETVIDVIGALKRLIGNQPLDADATRSSNLAT